MNLQQAQEQLEALPGVYDVSMFAPYSKRTFVQFFLRIASPELLPEETRQGILRIHETLERELGCQVSFAVSAGLRMPGATS